ncbi:Fe-S cluster assembly protein SufD [Virgisporangium aliadipatigenens]|uniref:Fe-S cluster assembly protein SufD n=1 Tax=Virgisporangium aliadipatigenens TaxID=741659 RepID=A0A8J3YLK9_9ACTN|nr:Fe-S cluster assembly protein SufD [Virgisporangium aliadipatigenens]GIJ47431.1 Fe-S cluster assembly protein SufD [Virgisporangium aliadipatigenens]
MTAVITPPKTKSQALRSFDVADFPVLNGREEEWRFTPLRRLGVLAKASEAATSAGVGHDYDELPAGVSVSTVERTDPRIGSVLTPFDRISALAYGGAGEALLISVARHATAPPATVRIVGRGADPAYGHTFVEVGELSQSTLVLEHTGSAVLADNVEVDVADGAHLTLVTVADWAPDAIHAQHVKFRLGRDARVVHVQVALGGDLVRQYTSVEYSGRGGDCEAYGLYFAAEGQHQEHRLLVDHSVPDCRSYVNYRGALQGTGSHTVWVGDVLIRAEATGTDTYEINRNLVLTDGARADSVPNLEIETGEVAGAGHASATGRFDDEQLFYLMSRGIPDDVARKLVVRGFFHELLGKIPVEGLRERLADAVEARLSESGS